MLADTPVCGAVKDFVLPLPTVAEGQKWFMVNCAAIWPHELVHALYENSRQHFVERMLGGSADRLPTFWKQMRDHPAMQGHPLQDRSDHQTMCVPWSFHVDGVAVSGIAKAWSQTMEIYSWTSMVSTGRTLDYQFLIFLIYRGMEVEMMNY